jgi:hypothetical protein
MVAGILAASQALAGRQDQAQHAMTLATLADWFPIRRPEYLTTFADGLRRVGLPE